MIRRILRRAESLRLAVPWDGRPCARSTAILLPATLLPKALFSLPAERVHVLQTQAGYNPAALGAQPMFSTLIFDLSEVLISGLWGAEKELAARLGLPEKVVVDALWIPWATALFEGRLTEHEYLQEVVRRSGWAGISPEEVGGYLRQNFCVCVPGMEDMLQDLSQRYELVLLSDHAREWVEFIHQQHPFLDLFSQQFFSYELRHTKRERITFLTVLYKLGRQAGECVFVDDLATNVQVARSVGIHAVQFTSPAALTADLRNLGLDLG
jgi:HAD superfamily hydrolase (TIGR01509 family)